MKTTNNDQIILKAPTPEDANAVMEFRRAMMAEGLDGTNALHGCCSLEDVRSFEEWMDFNKIGHDKYGEHFIPGDPYLVIRKRDGKIVGMMEFRYPDKNKLLEFIGHIGCSVHPDERRKGYFCEMLRQMFPLCALAGERRVVFATAKENIAVIKGLQTVGCRLEEEFEDHTGLSKSNRVLRFSYKISDRKTNSLLTTLAAARDLKQAVGQSRFFKTGIGQYGEGDKFWGIKVPAVRRIVKSLSGQVSFDDLEECIVSPYHEVRLAALLYLITIYKHAKKDQELKQKCISFYLDHTKFINNWDLVDLSCYELLGDWLLDKDRSILYDLVQKGKTLWENRIGIVSTMQFIRHGQFDDTIAIAELLLSHPHDLIHKAVGWLLREVGKRNKAVLNSFLQKHSAHMPRTALRYAIERFPQEEKQYWLHLKF